MIESSCSKKHIHYIRLAGSFAAATLCVWASLLADLWPCLWIPCCSCLCVCSIDSVAECFLNVIISRSEKKIVKSSKKKWLHSWQAYGKCILDHTWMARHHYESHVPSHQSVLWPLERISVRCCKCWQVFVVGFVVVGAGSDPIGCASELLFLSALLGMLNGLLALWENWSCWCWFGCYLVWGDRGGGMGR